MREKFTLIKALQKRAKVLKDKKRLAIIGHGDFPGTNNIMRATMNIKHQVQHLAIDNPTFPMIYDGKENVAGKYSSFHDDADTNYEVVDIIRKYDSRLKGKARTALMFLYSKELDKYKLIERKEVQNLIENFGFRYNTEYFDNCAIGDTVEKGDMILKSSSYDEDGNTCMGTNGRILFTTHVGVQDDAIMVSEKFCSKMVTHQVTSINVPLNDDAVLLNLYGDDKHYQGLPNIGDKINNGVLCATRIIRPSRMFSDFRDSALSTINLQSDAVYFANGEVVDIVVYCNNRKIKSNMTNEQLLEYLIEGKRFYSRVYRRCKAIKESGAKIIDKEIGRWMKLAIKHLDDDAIWAFNDITFSNLMVEILITKAEPLRVGRKVTGRHGNKTVISKVIPESEMPYLTEEVYTDEYGVVHPKGERIDIDWITSPLAIINRSIPMALFEPDITFILDRVRNHMKTLEIDDARVLLFDVLTTLNPRFGKQLLKVYNELSPREQKEFMRDAINKGISVRWDAFDAETNWRDNLIKCHEKFKDIIKPLHIFYPKPNWGRDVYVGQDYVGYQYMYMLKQSDDRGYSVRSSGTVSDESLPERSNDSRIGRARHSNTAIRFGEYETPNFNIITAPEDFALVTALYRSSVDGRRFMYEAIVSEDGKYDIPDNFTSRTSEILQVYMKSLGIRMETILDDDEYIGEEGHNEIIGYKVKHYMIFCTANEMYYLKKLKKVYKRYQKENPDSIDDIDCAWEYILDHLSFKKKHLTDEIISLFRNNIQAFS